MYISNSSNVGMATLLQQNKACVKTLSNGTTSSNIIVGNVSSSASQVNTSTGVASNGNNLSSGGSIVLPMPSPGTTILLANGASGASSVITYQQYQQLLQQQAQQSVPNHTDGVTLSSRLTASQEMAGVSVSRVSNTHTITQSNVFATTNGTSNKIITSNNSVLGFQQQFQHQVLAAGANSSRVVIPTVNGVIHQQMQGQTNSSSANTTTRYFAQFSQTDQQQIIQSPAILNGSSSPRTILISRHHNALSPRQHISAILNKSVGTASQQTQITRAPTLLRNANVNPPAVIKKFLTKASEPGVNSSNELLGNLDLKTTTLQQKHRYGISTIQQIKMQQEKCQGDRGATGSNNSNEQKDNNLNKSQIKVEEPLDSEPEIDIVINNVVCSFSVRCHLNLREIALNGSNVEYRRENGMVTMKLRRPYTTASIWSSGRITCTGATSESQAKIAARRYARLLQKLGFRVRFHNFRVVNVLGTCSMPWAIKIVNFSEKYKKEASYEPELHPGVTYKLRYPKATLKIFSTGSITVTAASVANVQIAIEHIYPLVHEFRKNRSPQELEQLRLKQEAAGLHNDPEVIDSENLAELIEYVPTDADVEIAENELPANSSPPPPSKVVDTKAIKPNNIRGISFGTHPNSSNLVSHKRRRLNSHSKINHFTTNIGDDCEVDDPEEPTVVVSHDNLDDFIEYTEIDDSEDIIEGPDDVIQI